ncbi:MAG TPA: T9SS type A sorting domain-containing protein, partial [Bacteroidota bacterium]|nr:T9SS type A sorting domain-containing protein [Bacteroidota bacterium]
GSYSFTFDGSNLSSGVYFYRLSTGSSQITRSMMLLK